MPEDKDNDRSEDGKGDKFHLKERWVWLWHPHFWLTLLIVAIVIFLAIKLAA